MDLSLVREATKSTFKLGFKLSIKCCSNSTTCSKLTEFSIIYIVNLILVKPYLFKYLRTLRCLVFNIDGIKYEHIRLYKLIE